MAIALIIVACITLIGTIVNSVFSSRTALKIAAMQLKQTQQGVKQDKMEKKQDEIHKQINGMQAALITSEKAVSKQEGKDEEKSDEAERQSKQ